MVFEQRGYQLRQVHELHWNIGSFRLIQGILSKSTGTDIEPFIIRMPPTQKTAYQLRTRGFLAVLHFYNNPRSLKSKAIG